MNIDKNKAYEKRGYKFINFVQLSPPESEMILENRNHPDIRKYMYNDNLISKEEHLNFINSLKDKNDRFYWVVYRYNVPIGVVNLTDIDSENKSGEVGYYLFVSSQGKGMGKTMLESFHSLLFDTMELNQTHMWVENNNSALFLDLKIGYKDSSLTKFIGNRQFIKLIKNPKEVA